ncbi:F-box/LRR-repeat protein 21-like [Centruroides sculpturatus]|uniref:F-box/LRR-repeat protein 21-like n=1 Tax=Centruroides sculpturatus TaxID=218467 RepID=UPI000C6DBFED|nr:F-box/LRR-repeat protein 21-like [Centruroides sculpturatus]
MSLKVFKHLQIYDRAQAARVCQHWYRVYQVPQLWQSFEFIISQPQRSSLQPTSPALIQYILNQHAKHLRFVTFKVDSSQESAEMACRILAQLVDCSLKTLGLISSAKPSFMKLDPDRFVSALTLVIDKCHSLSSLAIEETPVDDPSLQLLATNSCNSLELLWMKSCPNVSAKGIQAVADHCHQLCELTLNYSLLSDDLLLALSSEEHARLKFMRVDVSSDDLQAIAVHHVSSESWQALVKHSPMAKHCPCLMELVIGSNGNSIIDQEILSVARGCPKLASLGLGMCEISCSAILELVKICGTRLKKLYVLEESMIEDEQHDIAKTCFEVSHIIGYEWCPDVMPVW